MHSLVAAGGPLPVGAPLPPGQLALQHDEPGQQEEQREGRGGGRPPPGQVTVEWPRGLGRWSLMREVQSSNPRRGYIPCVTAEMQWHGVTPPGCDQWQTDR